MLHFRSAPLGMNSPIRDGILEFGNPRGIDNYAISDRRCVEHLNPRFRGFLARISSAPSGTIVVAGPPRTASNHPALLACRLSCTERAPKVEAAAEKPAAGYSSPEVP